MKHSLTLGRRSLLAWLASAALLPALPALADTPAVLNATGLSGSLSGSDVSSSFTIDRQFPAQAFVGYLFAFSATFPSGAAGSLFLERSSDGGTTWTLYKVGSQVVSVLTATGFRNVFEPQQGAFFRLRAAMTTGSVDYVLQWTTKKRTTVLVQPATMSAPGGYSPVVFDQSGPFSLMTGESYIYDPVSKGNIVQENDTTAVERSTDGGSTWSTIYGATTRAFCYAVMPGTDAALYRMKFVINSRAAKGYSVYGQYEVDAEVVGAPHVERWENYLTISTAQRQALEQARWTYLADADIAGDLTLYKVCKNNLLVKMTVPAAAKRTRAWGATYGGWASDQRSYRAEYVDVVSVIDGKGIAKPSAISFSDMSMTFTPGHRVTAKTDKGGWAGDFLSPAAAWGIHGFPTLLEAACYAYLDQASAPPNLTALGL